MHKASFAALPRHGSYWGESGLNADIANCRLLTQSGRIVILIAA
jgi:hypothetical protein